MPKHFSAFFLAAMIAAATSGWSGDGNGGGVPLRIVTGPSGGQWDAVGNALATALATAGVPAASKSGGGMENLRAVGGDDADIGFTLYSFLAACGMGHDSFSEIDADNIHLMANLYPQVLYIIVRKEVADRHGLKSLDDLLQVEGDLRFSTLPVGTGSEFLFNQLLKSGYRTSYDQLAEQGWRIGFDSYQEISRQFLEGELDVCAYTAGPGTFLIPALEEKNLEAVLLPVGEDTLDLMTHQFMTIAYTIRKGDYQSVDADVNTLGDYSCLVVRKNLDEDTVHRVNEILWENKLPLTAVSRDMEHLSPRFAIAGQGEVHSGSRRFWESEEMQEIKKRGAP